MIVQPTLEIPAEIATGLANKNLVRMGGVIRESGGMRIVQHLRETALSPQALGQQSLNSLLGFGSVASILNLGATVAFGVGTLRKLGKMDGKLDTMDRRLGTMDRKLNDIDRKLDKVTWTVERVYGISTRIWDEVDEIRSLIEDDIQAGMTTASGLAVKAQAREPGDPQRIQLFTAAQEKAAHAAARLRLKTRRDLEFTATRLDERKKVGKFRQLGPDSLQKTVDALRGYRLTVGALSLKSLIGADAGFLGEEIDYLKSASEELTQRLQELGRAFFKPKQFCTYDYFLNRYFGVECPAPEKRITATRLARLASKVDPTVTDVDDLIQQLQEHQAPDYHKLNEMRRDWESWINPLPTAFYELEKAFEDCDRLQGHLAEFEFCHEHHLSIQQYREFLEVKDLPEEGQLVFFELAA